jgi:hypothetical protein
MGKVMESSMNAHQENHKLQQAQSILVKILAAIYVGGAYGLILITMVQVAIVISWFD